eukprot:711795-Prymnesium_polylepis.1
MRRAASTQGVAAPAAAWPLSPMAHAALHALPPVAKSDFRRYAWFERAVAGAGAPTPPEADGDEAADVRPPMPEGQHGLKAALFRGWAAQVP